MYYVTSVRVGVQASTVSALLFTTAVSEEMPKQRTSWNMNMWIHINKVPHAGVWQGDSQNVNWYSHFWEARWCSARASWKAPSTVRTARGSAREPGDRSMCASSGSSSAHSWPSLLGKRRRGINTCASCGMRRTRACMFRAGWLTEMKGCHLSEQMWWTRKIRCAALDADWIYTCRTGVGKPLAPVNRDTKWETQKAKRQMFFFFFFHVGWESKWDIEMLVSYCEKARECNAA